MPRARRSPLLPALPRSPPRHRALRRSSPLLRTPLQSIVLLCAPPQSSRLRGAHPSGWPSPRMKIMFLFRHFFLLRAVSGHVQCSSRVRFVAPLPGAICFLSFSSFSPSLAQAPPSRPAIVAPSGQGTRAPARARRLSRASPGILFGGRCRAPFQSKRQKNPPEIHCELTARICEVSSRLPFCKNPPEIHQKIHSEIHRGSRRRFSFRVTGGHASPRRRRGRRRGRSPAAFASLEGAPTAAR